MAPNPRRCGWLVAAAAALLAVVVLAAFFPALGAGFALLDDEKSFLKNPSYRGLGSEQLRWMFTTNHMGHYMPVTWLTLGLDYVAWGMRPEGYHLTSLLFHVANALLFFFLARSLLGGAGEAAVTGASAFAAVVFAAHPLRVESVAWISERRDVVCGFFSLLCVLAYVSAARRPARRAAALAASLGLFVLALLSKGIAVALPIALLALDATFLGRLPPRPGLWLRVPWRAVLLEKVPYLVVAGASSLVTTWAIRYVLAPVGALGADARMAAAATGLTWYLQKTLLPCPLPLVVPRTTQVSLATLEYAVRAGLVLVAIGLLFAVRRRSPALVAAAATYAALVLPVSGLLQAGPQLVAHRYTYLSCLPWALLAGAGVLRAAPAIRGRAARVASLAALLSLVAGLVALTRAQVRLWHDPFTFATAAVAGAPKAPEPRYALAVLELRAGRWEEAARQVRIGLLHNPASRGLMSLAALLLSTCPDDRIRRPEEAMRQALRLCRDTELRDAWALFALSAALAESGEYAAAVSTARRSRALAERHGQDELLRRLDTAQPLFESLHPYRMTAADWGTGPD